MKRFTPHIFEHLKACVLANAHIEVITSHDCKSLSAYIFNKTKHTISETTLKRVYGFAQSKFAPSAFTLDSLSQFCGYMGWDDFGHKQQPKLSNPAQKDIDWQTLGHNASKITNFTLQALKNRSGIPFNQTIKRQFINEHFEGFLADESTGTVITAPSGYGKTLALCHWIEEKLTVNNSNDIILFFSSSALMNVFLTGRNLNDWLLALLGYSNDDMLSLLDIKERLSGNFYLVVDGFDEHMFKPDQFQLLLDQLMDIFAFYQQYKWFKLVLTMRSANWINNRHSIASNNNTWYIGGLTDAKLITNVPLFSINEIRELCLKINPNMKDFISDEAAETFNHPLYFQFYYKQHKEGFSLDYINQLSIYELISAFIYTKVYLGHHATEKVLLLNALLQQIDLKNKEEDIDKLAVNELLKQYHHAYNELLDIGFLREVNNSSGMEFNVRIQFGNRHFFEYAVAKKILSDNNQVFNTPIINIINNLITDTTLKLSVLKWCIIYAVKSRRQRKFESIEHTHLTCDEQTALIIFMDDVIEKYSISA